RHIVWSNGNPWTNSSGSPSPRTATASSASPACTRIERARLTSLAQGERKRVPEHDATKSAAGELRDRSEGLGAVGGIEHEPVRRDETTGRVARGSGMPVPGAHAIHHRQRETRNGRRQAYAVACQQDQRRPRRARRRDGAARVRVGLRELGEDSPSPERTRVDRGGEAMARARAPGGQVHDVGRRRAEQELEPADLVAAAAAGGPVLALEPERGCAARGGEPGRGLERGRPVTETARRERTAYL